MALIVQKYGGTSVGSVERIKNVAQKVAKAKKKGNNIVVVVSAMSGETNKLVDLTHQAKEFPIGREYDVVVSTGEQVTIGLLALALQEIGSKAKSFMGHQVPIVTDSAFSKARIERIDTEKIFSELKKGFIIVVAGFQGIDEHGNITTLGRGGSDTTAVALAAALKADICEIYTDVDGVYTTDPNICPDARKLEKVSMTKCLRWQALAQRYCRQGLLSLQKNTMSL